MARIEWTEFDKDGFPSVLIKQTGNEGLKEEYKLHPLSDKIEIESNQRFSFPTANFFSGMEDKEWESGSEPAFYKANAKANTYSKDAPFVTWACLNQNKEVLHTIKLIIREWNTQEEFIRFKESEGSRGDPDITGAEGSECDYYENNTLNFGDCDDLWDVDKFESDYEDTFCKYICEKSKVTCDQECTRCDTYCTNVRGTCNTGCETDCYRGQRTACAGPKELCYESCQIAKEHEDVRCTGESDVAACKTASANKEQNCQTNCDNDENQCLRNNMPNPTDCIRACKDSCTTNEGTCKTDCTNARDTCNTGCQTTKDTCDQECDDYPLIKYK